MENEISYSENYKTHTKKVIDKYNKNIDIYIRNIELTKDDIEDGLLSDNFLKSSKLNTFIMDKLYNLTEEVKKEIEQYTIT